MDTETLGRMIRNERDLCEVALKILTKNQPRWSWLQGFFLYHLHCLAKEVARHQWAAQCDNNRRARRAGEPLVFMGEYNVELWLAEVAEPLATQINVA